METAALVAPVTAVEFVQDAFLLTGRQLFSEVFKIYIKYEYLSVLGRDLFYNYTTQINSSFVAQIW